jgi:YfiH family protein
LLRWRVATKSKRVPGNAIEVLRAESLARIPWLVHGFSPRHGGVSKLYGGNSLNLGFTADDSRSAVARNREAFVKAVTPRNRQKKASARARSTWPLTTGRQIHSDLVHYVSQPAEHPLAGDGLITRTPGILIAVLAADCLPILVVDTAKHAVGVFHAGWRGTLKRILEKGVGEMRRHFGSRPEDLRAAIGPGIRACCYQVGPEIKDKFEGQFAYASELFHETKEIDEVRKKYPLLFLSARAPGHTEMPKKIFLDLAEANRRQLIATGVPVRNISVLDFCTSCRTDLFFSHRAENGRTGRMMAAVGIRK